MGFLGANSIFLPPEQRANFQGNQGNTQSLNIPVGGTVPGASGLTFQGSTTGGGPVVNQQLSPDRFTQSHPQGIQQDAFFQGLSPEFQDLFTELDRRFGQAQDFNQGVTDESSATLQAGGDLGRESLAGASDQLDINTPLNPFSDQIREMQFNQINDTLRRQGRDAVAVQRASLASRGVLGGGQFADIQRQSEATNRLGSSQADVGLRTLQEKFNIASNQNRQALTNQLGISGADLETRLAAVASQIPLANLIDPNSRADISAQVFGANQGQQNADQFLDFARIQEENANAFIPGVINAFTAYIAGTNPNSPRAQTAIPVGQAVSNLFQAPLLGGR